MYVSARIAVWLCGLFALVCLGFALRGFLALPSTSDTQERDLISGYAWYWTFLGVVALVFGVLSWLITRGKFGDVK
jgi:phosphotransferase system  glucose/maltose/N-acetylglucosamine-specific IIC component